MITDIYKNPFLGELWKWITQFDLGTQVNNKHKNDNHFLIYVYARNKMRKHANQ